MTRILAPAALALVLLAGGCSGSDDGDDTTGPTPAGETDAAPAAPELGAWHELVPDRSPVSAYRAASASRTAATPRSSTVASGPAG